MSGIGTLHIPNTEALPFARQKLRDALVAAGLSQVQAGQIVGVLSGAMRTHLPTSLDISLDRTGLDLLLGPEEVCGSHHRLRLAQPLQDTERERMHAILSELSREELMADLEQQVVSRTADLEAERQKSERLLQNMMPAPIARRLKNGQTIADHHMASVVFIDIVNFTRWAMSLNASELVHHLDHIFGEFDDITRAHGLEKIKTIGDCYMAAAGLPAPQDDHAERAVAMGLDIIDCMNRLRADERAALNVRVGIHCGPLVAGVIGQIKPFYDIWGDTVNIASRMESHGQPGRVHISDDVRMALTSNYRLEKRGAIDIKNRGQITTWFVARAQTDPL